MTNDQTIGLLDTDERVNLFEGESFLQLVDHMGTDLNVVNAARLSFDKTSEFYALSRQEEELLPLSIIDGLEDPAVIGSPRLGPKDAKLIRYLAEHNHWTPFAHCYVSMHIKMPICIERQWRTSRIDNTMLVKDLMAFNEVSRRYVDAPPTFHRNITWRSRHGTSNKQGSGEALPTGHQDFANDVLNHHIQDSERAYKELLKLDVCPEQSRFVLPLNTYTEFIGTASLATWARIYMLRSDPHAQWEIQQYAHAAGSIVSHLFPFAWAALTGNPKE